MNSEFWNERFSTGDYIYGVQPNEYLKQQLEKLTPGRILLPADGEGRNGVYAALLGWKVDAVDFSETAKNKAMLLAARNNVDINYEVADLNNYQFRTSCYDAASLIFLHMDESLSRKVFSGVIGSLKTGGKLILELFSKNQYGKTSGGPQNLNVLYSLDEVLEYTKTLQTITAGEEEVVLSEGEHHTGSASVIRYTGLKL